MILGPGRQYINAVLVWRKYWKVDNSNSVIVDGKSDRVDPFKQQLLETQSESCIF